MTGAVTQRVSHRRPDPVTVSIVPTGRNSADVTLGLGATVRLASNDLRTAIGLYLASVPVALGATVWTQINGRDFAGQSDEYLRLAETFTNAHGKRKAAATLKGAINAI